MGRCNGQWWSCPSSNRPCSPSAAVLWASSLPRILGSTFDHARRCVTKFRHGPSLATNTTSMEYAAMRQNGQPSDVATWCRGTLVALTSEQKSADIGIDLTLQQLCNILWVKWVRPRLYRICRRRSITLAIVIGFVLMYDGGST